MELPDDLLDLLRRPSPCFVATTMPDGSPQLTQTWVDTDGRYVLVNTVVGFRKVRNLERDPRTALTVCDPALVARYFQVRGRVVATTTDGATEHIEQLSQRYLGAPYPYGARDRVILSIEAEHITSVP